MKSMKNRATQWVTDHFASFNLEDKDDVRFESTFNFIIEGFTDEPEVYIAVSESGLEFGYKGILWDGHFPVLVNVKKHILPFETLQSLTKEKILEEILELLLKTINSRKRQYLKCQFCKGKFPPGQRYDKVTCHGCASNHFGILY